MILQAHKPEYPEEKMIKWVLLIFILLAHKPEYPLMYIVNILVFEPGYFVDVNVLKIEIEYFFNMRQVFPFCENSFLSLLFII